jgi:hypothetical protein
MEPDYGLATSACAWPLQNWGPPIPALARIEADARAYFLAASCIEESGKAVQAFEGLARNLKGPAVVGGTNDNADKAKCLSALVFYW